MVIFIKSHRDIDQFGALFGTALYALFVPIFRESVFYALGCFVQGRFEVRWKVLILAHPTVGQTSNSDRLGPFSLILKFPDCHVIVF